MVKKVPRKTKTLLTAEAAQTVGLAGLALASESVMLIGGLFAAIGLTLAIGCCVVVIILHWQEMWAAIRSRRFSRHSILPLTVVIVVLLLGGLVANKDAILEKKAATSIEPSPHGIVAVSAISFSTEDLINVAHANAHPLPNLRMPTVLVNCHDTLIPNIVLNPNEHAYFLMIPKAMQSAPFWDYTSPTGGVVPLNKKDAMLADGYFCTITNYSKMPLSSIRIGIVQHIWATKRLVKGGFQLGNYIRFLISIIDIGVINDQPFSFYIWNQGPYWEKIHFADRGVAINMETGQQQQINVLSTADVNSVPRYYYFQAR